jgi:hypothetical protein
MGVKSYVLHINNRYVDVLLNLLENAYLHSKRRRGPCGSFDFSDRVI